MEPPHRIELKGIMEGLLLAGVALGSGAGVFKLERYRQGGKK